MFREERTATDENHVAESNLPRAEKTVRSILFISGSTEEYKGEFGRTEIGSNL